MDMLTYDLLLGAGWGLLAVLVISVIYRLWSGKPEVPPRTCGCNHDLLRDPNKVPPPQPKPRAQGAPDSSKIPTPSPRPQGKPSDGEGHAAERVAYHWSWIGGEWLCRYLGFDERKTGIILAWAKEKDLSVRQLVRWAVTKQHAAEHPVDLGTKAAPVPVGKWVDANRELPPEGKGVLVCRDGGNVSANAYRKDGGWVFFTFKDGRLVETRESVEPTHWWREPEEPAARFMPIPEAWNDKPGAGPSEREKNMRMIRDAMRGGHHSPEAYFEWLAARPDEEVARIAASIVAEGNEAGAVPVPFAETVPAVATRTVIVADMLNAAIARFRDMRREAEIKSSTAGFPVQVWGRTSHGWRELEFAAEMLLHNKGIPVAVDVTCLPDEKQGEQEGTAEVLLKDGNVVGFPQAVYHGCSQWLRLSGKAYPKTCAKCGLGPCRHEMVMSQVAEVRPSAAEESSNKGN